MPGFGSIFGNEDLIRQLKGAGEKGRLQHAYIFEGEKGLGKKTLAEALVLDLFCAHKKAADPEGSNADPDERIADQAEDIRIDDASPERGEACLECAECRKVLNRNHPDVIYIAPEEGKSLSVGEIREKLVDTAAIRPYEGRYKVYIVDDAQKMNEQAQNALLKTLEEPPEYVIIILLCTDVTALLETVRSRALKLRLRPLSDEQMQLALRSLGYDDEVRIELAAAFARGSVGRARELYESEEFDRMYQEVIGLCRNVRQMDAADIFAKAKALSAEYADLSAILDMLEVWFKDLLVMKTTKDAKRLLFRGEKRAVSEAASLYAQESIEKIMDSAAVCRRRLAANVNREMSLELLLLDMKEL